MPIERGMEKISQPVRILAIVIVLAGAAGMLAMRMLGPSAVDGGDPATARRRAHRCSRAHDDEAGEADPGECGEGDAGAREGCRPGSGAQGA